MLVLIAAMSKDGLIGKNDIMPWHNREDLQHFKRTTLQKNVVMGRKTYENLPKTLGNRTLYIVSRSLPGTNVIRDFTAFLKEHQHSKDVYFIAGGGTVYEQAIPYAQKLILSFIPGVYEGDTFFPSFSLNDFVISKRHEYATFKQISYERK